MSAHVKWFCNFDVASQPRGLLRVFATDFNELNILALLLLLVGCLAEGTSLGGALLNAIDRVTAPLRSNGEALARAVFGFFFVSVWSIGNVLLTPELKTVDPLIPWMQLAMAAALLWRRTLPFTALGIVVLYGLGVRQAGIFHMLDYPIFLGVAAYLAMTGLGKTCFGLRPVDVVRIAAGLTLMWASIEKWAYPEWTFTMFVTKPEMTMGFDQEFFMRAAGVVEFALAFALLWTPLVRRVAAVILAAMFISAVFKFGKIDLVGHSAIIAVMLLIIGDDARTERLIRPIRSALLAPATYAAALAVFLAGYYGAHSWLFGTTIL